MKTKTLNQNFRSICMPVLFACLLFAGQTASAQDINKTSEELAETLTKMMKENLTLDDQQYSKVYALNLKYINKNKELQNSSVKRMSKMKTFKSNQEAKDKELKGILSNDQYKEYEKLKSKMKDEMKKEMKERKNNKK